MKIIIKSKKGKVTVVEAAPPAGAGGVRPGAPGASGAPKEFKKIGDTIARDIKKQETERTKALNLQNQQVQKQIQALQQQIAQVNPSVDPNKPPQLTKPGQPPKPTTPQKATEPPPEPPKLDPSRAEQERKQAEAAAKNNPAQKTALGKAVTSLSAALAMRPK